MTQTIQKIIPVLYIHNFHYHYYYLFIARKQMMCKNQSKIKYKIE